MAPFERRLERVPGEAGALDARRILGDSGEDGERALVLTPYQFQLLTTTLWEQCRIVVSHTILSLDGKAPLTPAAVVSSPARRREAGNPTGRGVTDAPPSFHPPPPAAATAPNVVAPLSPRDIIQQSPQQPQQPSLPSVQPKLLKFLRTRLSRFLSLP